MSDTFLSERVASRENVASEDLAHDLRAVSQRLARKLSERSAGDGLAPLQRGILATLDVGGPHSSVELARQELVSAQAISAAVADLRQRGFVQQRPDPDDGRRRLVCLTPAGLGAIRAVRADKNAWLTQRIEHVLGDGERAQLSAAVTLLQRLIDSPSSDNS